MITGAYDLDRLPKKLRIEMDLYIRDRILDHRNDIHKNASEVVSIHGLPYWIMDITSPTRVYHTFGDRLPKGIKGAIVDAGCSCGHTTTEISHLYPEASVIGVDISGESIAEAYNLKRTNTNTRTEFRVGDIYRLSEQFDAELLSAVFMMNNLRLVLPRMSDEQLKDVLDSTVLTLREEGYLLISGGESFDIFQKEHGRMIPRDNRKSIGDDERTIPALYKALGCEYEGLMDILKTCDKL